MTDIEKRTNSFWELARATLADAYGHLRSAATLLDRAALLEVGGTDVQRAELARALAELFDASDRVDAKLLGIVAAELAAPGDD